MSYKAVLIDRNGDSSPYLLCDIHCEGTELEIDAELSYEYIGSSHTVHIYDGNELVSTHEVLGYSFHGDTIINGVNASRCGHYILILGAAER